VLSATDDPSGWVLVVLTFFGTLGGALIGFFGVKHQLRQQETARKSARRDVGRDRQRSALEAMQEAVNQFAVDRMPSIGADTLEGRPTSIDGVLGLFGRARLTIARVHDDEARRRAETACSIAFWYLRAKTRDDILLVTGLLRDAVDEMHARVGTLLRDLDETSHVTSINRGVDRARIVERINEVVDVTYPGLDRDRTTDRSNDLAAG
jgi:hypothetical protein